MEFPEIFLRIISFVSDESDNLSNTSLRKTNRSNICLFVEISDDFPLEKRRYYLKIFHQKRFFSSEKYCYLRVDKYSEFFHISHKRREIFSIFGIDSFKFTDDIETKMITKIDIIRIGGIEFVRDIFFCKFLQDLSLGN